MVAAGETLFYLGSDASNAITDIFHKEGRALKSYKKVITGENQIVKEKVFNEMVKLLRN